MSAAATSPPANAEMRSRGETAVPGIAEAVGAVGDALGSPDATARAATRPPEGSPALTSTGYSMWLGKLRSPRPQLPPEPTLGSRQNVMFARVTLSMFKASP